MKLEIKCSFCGDVFKRERKEINRSARRGMNSYCSPSCSGNAVQNNLGIYFGQGNTKYLIANNRLDEFSPFRYYLNKARARNKECGWQEPDFDLKDLKELWESQNGKCPLTGWNMEHHGVSKQMPHVASLDRIVPRLPYTKLNIRFIAYMANLCKSTFSDEDVISFAKAVSDRV